MEMKNKANILFLLFLLSFTMFACGSKDEETASGPELIQPTQPVVAVVNNNLTLQAWQWIGFFDQVIGETAIANPQNYTISFQPDGVVQVKADCNNASGSYLADGINLSISPMAASMAVCAPESKGEQFLSYLGNTEMYTVENGRLQIQLKANGGTMTFISINATIPAVAQPTVVPTVINDPTAVPTSNSMITVAATTAPPVAPPPQGSVFDGGARAHANGSYIAPNYTVAAGDTLYSIGVRFNLLPTQIKSANGMANNSIYTNQVLLIPGANTNAPTPPQTNTPERVAFASGATSIYLSRTIDNGQPKKFVLTATAGQTMQIATKSNAEYLVITVQDYYGNYLPLNGINRQGENNVSLSLTQTGDYFVVITPIMQPESPSFGFDITFTIGANTSVTATPSPTNVAPPPSGSVVDGGARAHANGSYTAPYYTVAAGDTLHSVGLRFNLSPAQIQSANGMTNNSIYTNQVLLIPGANTNAIPTTPPQTGVPERVTFASGATSTYLSRSIDNGQPKEFVLTATAAQTMQIATKSNAEYLVITVQDYYGNYLPLNGINRQGENDVSLSLTQTGDYFVVITPIMQPESPSFGFDIIFVIQ